MMVVARCLGLIGVAKGEEKFNMTKSLTVLGSVAALMIGSSGVALADLAPGGVGGNPLVLVGIGIVVLLVLWMLIRGALSLGGKDSADDDSAGVGPLEGIDEDDENRKKKR